MSELISMHYFGIVECNINFHQRPIFKKTPDLYLLTHGFRTSTWCPTSTSNLLNIPSQLIVCYCHGATNYYCDKFDSWNVDERQLRQYRRLFIARTMTFVKGENLDYHHLCARYARQWVPHHWEIIESTSNSRSLTAISLVTLKSWIQCKMLPVAFNHVKSIRLNQTALWSLLG
jgi:hypothetical protein